MARRFKRTTSRLGWPHNVVAHPLWAVWPRVGFWLHERTLPVVPTWRHRLRKRFTRKPF